MESYFRWEIVVEQNYRPGSTLSFVKQCKSISRQAKHYVTGVIEVLVSKTPFVNSNVFRLERLVVLTVEDVLDDPRSGLILILRSILHQRHKFGVCAKCL